MNPLVRLNVLALSEESLLFDEMELLQLLALGLNPLKTSRQGAQGRRLVQRPMVNLCAVLLHLLGTALLPLHRLPILFAMLLLPNMQWHTTSPFALTAQTALPLHVLPLTNPGPKAKTGLMASLLPLLHTVITEVLTVLPPVVIVLLEALSTSHALLKVLPNPVLLRTT